MLLSVRFALSFIIEPFTDCDGLLLTSSLGIKNETPTISSRDKKSFGILSGWKEGTEKLSLRLEPNE